MKTCNKCNVEKSYTEYPKNKNYSDGYNSTCKKCKWIIDKKYYQQKKKDPVWWAKESERLRNWKRLKQTGFTSELFEQRLKEQDGKCAICKTADPGETNWHADHCHETGIQRGILCKKCNTGIGMLNDNIELLESAIKYLKHYTR